MEFIKIKDKKVWFSVDNPIDYTRLNNSAGVSWIKGTKDGVSMVKADSEEFTDLESYFEEWQARQEN